MDNTNTQGFTFALPKGNSSIIKVIGVGGGGNNALKHMYEKGIHGVDFVICNTDAQTLNNNPVANKVQLGLTMTEGLGAGADPEVGEKAAIESIEDIKAAMGANTKMVFITAGMGGGTGTGAAPIIAKVAKDMGILTVGIVTVPFSFEGKRRLDQAELGLEKLRNNVDSLIVINNDKLRQQFGNLGFKSGFSKADEVLTNAAKGMAEVITGYFDVNIDFRDAKSVLENSGTALMSNGVASGENKAEEAVKKALDSPLLNDNKITGAKNVLLLIRSGSEEVTMDEIGTIMDHIQKEAGDTNTADIIFGVGTDEELGDAVSVLVIATGFTKDNQKHAGTTETIKFTLEDHIQASENQKSPFRSKKEKEETPEIRTQHRNLFILDEEDTALEFKNTASQKTMYFEQEAVDTQAAFSSEEEIQPGETFKIVEEEEQPMDLFSFGFEAEDHLDAQSFTFETEEKQKPETNNEEKPVEFSFFVNEPIEEPMAETPQLLEKINEEPVLSTATEPVEDQTTSAPELIVEVEDEFTFFTKPASSDKVAERRNKLKEFNSRYQMTDAKTEFENVPAFRRKNINIDGANASEQTINTFLADNNGNMQVRENRFLNKDVD